MEKNKTGDQITCKCKCWTERLLHQGCLHDSCHQCNDNSALLNGVPYADIGARSHCKAWPACAACNEAMKQSAVADNGKLLATAEPFRLGRTTAPRTMDGLLGCECCLDQSTGASQRAAMYLCEECRVNLLCYECKQTHDKFSGDKHRVLRIGDGCRWPIQETEAPGRPEYWWTHIPPVLCRIHDSACDHWCCSCDTAKCNACALLCAERFHTLCSSDELDLQRCDALLRSSTSEIEKACDNFRHIETALELEHRADMAELKKRKKRILDALHAAFAASHETLEQSFQEARQWISNFRQSVDSAVRCSRILTQHSLPSHRVLIKLAWRAVDLHIHTAQRLMAREEAVLTRLGSSQLADDLDDVMKSWIGSPVAFTAPESNRVTPVTLLVDEATRLHPKFSCYSIEATLCGHFLVAAGNLGLQELDSRGLLIDTWLPTLPAENAGSCNHLTADSENVLEEVVYVKCLEDDRIIVGLKNTCAAVLLKRNSGGCSFEWREQQRFDLGQGAPFAIATRDNFLVVAFGSVHKDLVELLPGKHLVAFSIKNGIRQASADCNFEINSVVVAAQNAVIVASHDRVNANPARKGQFVIESRSSDLQSCQWKVLRDKPVVCLTVSYSGAQVHATIALERGTQTEILDTFSGLIDQSGVAIGYIGLQQKISGFHRPAVNSRIPSRRRYDADAAVSAANRPGALGETQICPSDRASPETCLISNTTLRTFWCSKSRSSKLETLEFDSKSMFNQSTDIEKPTLKDYVDCAQSAVIYLMLVSTLVLLISTAIVIFASLYLAIFFNDFTSFIYIDQVLNETGIRYNRPLKVVSFLATDLLHLYIQVSLAQTNGSMHLRRLHFLLYLLGRGQVCLNLL